MLLLVTASLFIRGLLRVLLQYSVQWTVSTRSFQGNYIVWILTTRANMLQRLAKPPPPPVVFALTTLECHHHPRPNKPLFNLTINERYTHCNEVISVSIECILPNGFTSLRQTFWRRALLHVCSDCPLLYRYLKGFIERICSHKKTLDEAIVKLHSTVRTIEDSFVKMIVNIEPTEASASNDYYSVFQEAAKASQKEITLQHPNHTYIY